MIFIIYLLSIGCISELGYLYSIGQRKFITYDNFKLRPADGDYELIPFEIYRSLPSDRFGILKPVPTFEDERRAVGMNIQRPFELKIEDINHGWNQNVEMKELPNDIMQLRIDGSLCIAATNDSLIKSPCDNSKLDKNQLFRWYNTRRIKLFDDDKKRYYEDHPEERSLNYYHYLKHRLLYGISHRPSLDKILPKIEKPVHKVTKTQSIYYDDSDFSNYSSDSQSSLEDGAITIYKK